MSRNRNDLTIGEILKLVPAVGELIRSARRKNPYCDICRLGLHRRPGYKQEIAGLVGWKSLHLDERLSSQRAYELVFNAVWKALPVSGSCLDCGDIWLEIEDDSVYVGKLQRRASVAKMRPDIWDKTEGKCWHCRKRLHPFRDFHIDHVMPKVLGGSDLIENLVPSCVKCNLSKSGKHPDDFLALEDEAL